MALGHSEDYFIRVLFKKSKIEESMKTSVVTIYVDDYLSKAYELVVKHGLSHLLVVDKQGKLAGLISPKYIFKAMAPKKTISGEHVVGGKIVADGDTFYEKDRLDQYSLGRLMYPNPFTLKAEDALEVAVLAMKVKNISCIPIVDEQNKVVGVFTNQEIVNYIADILMEDG